MQELTVKGVHKSLNTNGYICDVPFAARITSAMQTKPVSGAFLYGPAGTGKSYLPIVLSKTLGIEMFFYQCAPGTREDDLVLKMLPSEKTKSGMYHSYEEQNLEESILRLFESKEVFLSSDKIMNFTRKKLTKKLSDLLNEM